MKKFTIGLSLAALAIGGAALAAQGSGMMRGGATVTRADMQAHATQAFERLDANRDGKIDPADREARRAAMFDTIDADHNGQITKAEFLAHKPAWASAMAPEPKALAWVCTAAAGTACVVTAWAA